MFNKAQIFDLIAKALSYTTDHQAQVQVTSSSEGLSRIANSEIHQNVFEDRTTLTVTVYTSHKASSISTNILDDISIREAVDQAIANLDLLPDGEEQPPLVSEPQQMETLLFNSELHSSFSVQARAKLVAEGLQSITSPYTAYGQLSYRAQATGMGNSRGIRRYSDGNQVRFSLLVADDQGGAGYASMMANSLSEVDLESVFAIALQKAKVNRNPIDLEPGAYTVILEPLAVSNLLGMMMRSFSGAAVLAKQSFLTDRMGEHFFSEKLNACDDWTSPFCPGIAFDSEGTPRTRLNLIENGVVKEIAYDLSSASKSGMQSTGHAAAFMGRRGSSPQNVIISGGDKPMEQIIAETDKALLVTRFHYMNPVNMRQGILTGITRDGFYLIENGQITHAVRNMRFTESILLALSNIEEISSDRERVGAMMGSSYLPGMKIRDFHFTGRTSFGDTPGE